MRIKQTKMSHKLIPDSASNHYRRRSVGYLNENLMREMDISPLDDNQWQSSGSSKRKYNIPQVQHNEENQFNRSFEKSPFHGSKNDFALFRKQYRSEPSGVDHFSKVSDEIILHIFNFLPKSILIKCSSVCKRWRDLSIDESLWKRYDFGRRVVKSEVLEILLHRGVKFLRLAMSEMRRPVFSQQFLNEKWFCSLQLLDLSVTSITAEEISQLLGACCLLKKLSLEHCYLNEQCCRNIAHNEALQVLNMSMCKGLNYQCLYEISIGCKRLREWNLAWAEIGTPHPEFWSCMPSSLKRLNLSGRRDSLDDNGMIEVLTKCPDLVELDISDCHILSHITLKMIVKSCPKLEQLHSSRTFSIPTSSYKLLKDMKHFKNLEIFRTLTDEALAALTQYLCDIKLNKNLFSTIARPTTGIRRTSIWGVRVRD